MNHLIDMLYHDHEYYPGQPVWVITCDCFDGVEGGVFRDTTLQGVVELWRDHWMQSCG